MSDLFKFVMAAALMPLPLAAEPDRCLPRDEIVEALQHDFAEQSVGIGLEANKTLVEVFRSEDGASWTILQSFANGMSCVVATGTDWMAREPLNLAGVAS